MKLGFSGWLDYSPAISQPGNDTGNVLPTYIALNVVLNTLSLTPLCMSEPTSLHCDLLVERIDRAVLQFPETHSCMRKRCQPVSTRAEERRYTSRNL